METCFHAAAVLEWDRGSSGIEVCDLQSNCVWVHVLWQNGCQDASFGYLLVQESPRYATLNQSYKPRCRDPCFEVNLQSWLAMCLKHKIGFRVCAFLVGAALCSVYTLHSLDSVNSILKELVITCKPIIFMLFQWYLTLMSAKYWHSSLIFCACNVQENFPPLWMPPLVTAVTRARLELHRNRGCAQLSRVRSCDAHNGYRKSEV